MTTISKQLNLAQAAPLDARHNVFASVAAALAAIPNSRRYVGLTVNISTSEGVVEYWFKYGGLDADLIRKDKIDVAQSITINTSGELDLSSYSTVNVFYLNCAIDGLEITSIIPPSGNDFMFIFVSPGSTEYTVTIKHSNNIDCGGADNVFITNDRNWWIAKKDFNTSYIRQLNSNSTKEVAIEGSEPNISSTIAFVNYLPNSGTEDVLYVVTSVVPNPSFMWNGTDYIRVGEWETHLRYTEVKGLINTHVTPSLILSMDKLLNGYTLVANDLILVANQNNQVNNGVYQVTSIVGENANLTRYSNHTINILKGQLYKVVAGNLLLNSVWMISISSATNLDANFYKEGATIPEVGTANIIPRMLFTPASATLQLEGSNRSILYRNSDGIWVATDAPSDNSILIIKGGNPEWITGVVESELIMKSTGPVFVSNRPYPIVTIQDGDFTAIAPLNNTSAYKTVMDILGSKLYKYTSSQGGYRFITFPYGGPSGYYKTFTITNTSATTTMYPVFACISSSNDSSVLADAAKNIKWANGNILTEIGPGDAYTFYMSIQGSSNSDIIISYIKLISQNDLL